MVSPKKKKKLESNNPYIYLLFFYLAPLPPPPPPPSPPPLNPPVSLSLSLPHYSAHLYCTTHPAVELDPQRDIGRRKRKQRSNQNAPSWVS